MNPSLQPQVQDLATELQRFLAEPHPSVPASVLDFVAGTLAAQRLGLPPGIFRQAVDQSSVAISIADANGLIRYANAVFTRVTGYREDEVLGRNESMLSSKRTPSLVYKTLWGRLKQGQPWSGLLLNARKGGELYLAEVTIAPVRFGEVCYYLAMHRDVTEVHRLQQRVSNQKALIESVVDASPVATALLASDARVVLDNQAYKKLVGDMRGREPARIFLDLLGQGSDWDFASARDAQRDFDHREIAYDPGNGRPPRWFTLSGTWVEEADLEPAHFFDPARHIYLLLVASEITALKRQQEALSTNALRAMLAEDERVQSLQETLEAAIYQLQGPVNLMAAAAALLAHREAGEVDVAALRQALDQALGAGRQALETLHDAIPRMPPEAEATYNLNELLREVLAVSTQRLLATGITVDWQPAPVLPALVGRGKRLRGLFKHLIDNAIDAMVGSAVRELRISTEVGAEAIQVTVADTGPGVPETLRLRVFEPFFTTRDQGRRAGMGLTLVQEVVNEHRGTVAIDPGYREGCRVRVVLPIRG